MCVSTAFLAPHSAFSFLCALTECCFFLVASLFTRWPNYKCIPFLARRKSNMFENSVGSRTTHISELLRLADLSWLAGGFLFQIKEMHHGKNPIIYTRPQFLPLSCQIMKLWTTDQVESSLQLKQQSFVSPLFWLTCKKLGFSVLPKPVNKALLPHILTLM